MSFSLKRFSRVAALALFAVFALATPGGNDNSGQPVKHVTAGAGLTGGGDGPTVTVAIANGGITTAMLAPATVTALHGSTGPQGPVGPQGPAGPPGSGGGGGVVYRHILQRPDFSITTVDVSATGQAGYDENNNPVYVLPAVTKSVNFSLTSAGIPRVKDLTFANGVFDADGYSYTNFWTQVELLDASNAVIARYGPLTLSDPGNSGYLLSNGLLLLQPGNYTLTITDIVNSSFHYTYADNSYRLLPFDVSLIEPHTEVEVVSQIGWRDRGQFQLPFLADFKNREQ